MTATNMCSNFGSKWCSPPLMGLAFMAGRDDLILIHVIVADLPSQKYLALL